PGVAPVQAYTSIGAGLRLHYRRVQWLATEIHGSWLLSAQPFRPLHNSENDKSRQMDDVALNRFLVSVRPVLVGDIGDRPIELSVNPASIGFSHSFTASDATPVGDLAAFWAPSLEGRFYPTRIVFVELAAQLFYPEPIYEFHTDFTGTP